MTKEQREKRRRSLALQEALDHAAAAGGDRRAQLAELARRRTAAIHAYDATLFDLERIVLEAREEGITVSEIADTLGMSRPSVYAVLERASELDDDERPRRSHVRGGPRTASQGRFMIYRDAQGGFRWQLLAANQRLVAVSPEAYSTVAQARKSVDLVRRHAAAAAVYEQH